MYFQAISIGCAVPEDAFQASVHSVFRSAINLLPEKVDLLLTLHASGEADLPQGIRLDAPTGLSLEGFHTGELAVCREGLLEFKDSGLAIRLKGARIWRCDLPALGIDASEPSVANSCNFVRGMLKERRHHSDLEMAAGQTIRSHQSSRADAAMRELVSAARKFSLARISAVHSLIGLGSGLTPSGDDLLAGYMAGLWCTVRGRTERREFVSGLGEAVIRGSRETNDISRTYLVHAARGQVSSLLVNLAEAIGTGSNRIRLSAAAEKAMRVGHTSGMDTVTGLLMGLTTWDDVQPVNG